MRHKTACTPGFRAGPHSALCAGVGLRFGDGHSGPNGNHHPGTDGNRHPEPRQPAVPERRQRRTQRPIRPRV